MRAPAFDYWSTVQPAAGLVRAACLQRPEPWNSRLWTFALDIGRGEHTGQAVAAGDYPLDLVGAVGLSRQDAFVRGVGEAVERYALFAEPGEGIRYATTDLVSGGAGPVLSASLVDYPCPGAALSSPSGAASGVSRESALNAALRELVERDAVMVAWGLQARLEALPLETVGWPELRALLTRVEEQQLSAVVGSMPTAVPGLRAYVGCVVGDSPCSAVGSAVSAVPEVGATRALREALQVLTVLRGVHDLHGPGYEGVIDSDLSRARYWTGAAANKALRVWTDGFVPADLPRDADEPELACLARAVVDTAGPACYVDLTQRLPVPVQDLGWHAVKVVVPGLQPLRMTELPADEWRAARLGGARPTEVPHPWI